MSETVLCTGKAKLYYQGDDIESECEKIVTKLLNKEKESRWEDYTEYVDCELDNFVIVMDRIYELLINTDHEASDGIYCANKNTNDEIEYTLSYYNGGCSFEEAFEEAIKNMEKK